MAVGKVLRGKSIWNRRYLRKTSPGSNVSRGAEISFNGDIISETPLQGFQFVSVEISMATIFLSQMLGLNALN